MTIAQSVSISGAAQVLRPPSDGLPYLRLDRASELRTDPGEISLDRGVITGFQASAEADVEIDGSGAAVLPGFVDCHTHLPFAGWREQEYAMKIAGESYEAIARSGGGIRASARALADATDHAVLTQASALAAEMLAHGTTAFECKCGYGLSPEQEERSVRLAVKLHDRVPQLVRSTGLLAHAVPDGYDADGWMDVVEEMLPRILRAGDLSALDIYVESVAFQNSHLRRMGELARRHALGLRAHVEQFNWNESVPVAVELGARSVDHLACLPAAEVGSLAASETAAVLLPGAEWLGDEHLAPGRELADAGAICVLGSDLNPGTSPVASLPLIIGLAVRRYRFSALEAVLACTLNAAWVLHLSDVTGSLEIGKRADVVLLDGPVGQVPYRFGHNPVAIVICGGEIAHVREDQRWRVRR